MAPIKRGECGLFLHIHYNDEMDITRENVMFIVLTCQCSYPIYPNKKRYYVMHWLLLKCHMKYEPICHTFWVCVDWVNCGHKHWPEEGVSAIVREALYGSQQKLTAIMLTDSAFFT